MNAEENRVIAMAAALPASVTEKTAGPVDSGMFAPGVDYAALWREVDAEAAHVVILDLVQHSAVAGRSLDEADGSAGRFVSESVLKRMFPGWRGLVERWSTATSGTPGELVSHSFSARQWAYFWRIDAKVGVVALVQHRYGRGAASAGDSAIIRVLSEHWLAPELQAMGVGRAAAAPWNRVERRARATAPASLWGALVALVIAAACGLWLVMGVAGPLLQSESSLAREAQRLAKLSDATIVRALSEAMASGDYGVVQDALDEHRTLEHYEAAAVVNERKQVVAHVGFARPPVVGQALPTELERGTRRFALAWAGSGLGELVTMQRPLKLDAEGAQQAAKRLRMVGAMLAAVALLFGGLLLRHLRTRYR